MTKDEKDDLINIYNKGNLYPRHELGELKQMRNLLEVIILKHKFIHPMDQKDSRGGKDLPYQPSSLLGGG